MVDSIYCADPVCTGGVGVLECAMSNGYNKIVVVGNLGDDPESRYTQNQKLKVGFSLAVNTGYGSYERTDWFRVECWGKTAENAAAYLHKGSKVLVEGEMRNNKWTTDDGANRDYWHINAFKVLFMDSKEQKSTVPAPEVDDDSSIPF